MVRYAQSSPPAHDQLTASILRNRTLQELLAPVNVLFYDQSWSYLGDKHTWAEDIARLTGIDKGVLKNPSTMFQTSVAHRMSWISRRSATRAEDLSYSLLGIFGVNMSMLYGEGARAFLRLQKEILKTTNDQSLFAWGLAPRTVEEAMEDERLKQVQSIEDGVNFAPSVTSAANGMLAPGPMAFERCGQVQFLRYHAPNTQILDVNGAFYLELPIFRLEATAQIFYIGLLPCISQQDNASMMGVMLKRSPRGRFRRVIVQAGYSTFFVSCALVQSATMKHTWIDTAEGDYIPIDYNLSSTRQCLIITNDTASESLRLTRRPDKTDWNPKSSTLYLAGHSNYTWTDISFAIKSSQDNVPLAFKVAILTSGIGSGDNIESKVLLSWPGKTTKATNRDMSHDAVSRARLLGPHAKVEAALQSRVIFNQVITELRINVRRYATSE